MIIIPMRMPKVFKILAILLLVVEVAGFVIVARLIGVGATLLLIILSSFFGVYILKTANFKGSFGQTQFAFASFLRFFAGILFIIPGFITDFLALLLLIPQMRGFCMKWFDQYNPSTPTSSKNSDVLEGEYWETKNSQHKNFIDQ